jgi:hypothetical protein
MLIGLFYYPRTRPGEESGENQVNLIEMVNNEGNKDGAQR